MDLKIVDQSQPIATPVRNLAHEDVALSSVVPHPQPEGPTELAKDSVGPEPAKASDPEPVKESVALEPAKDSVAPETTKGSVDQEPAKDSVDQPATNETTGDDSKPHDDAAQSRKAWVSLWVIFNF